MARQNAEFTIDRGPSKLDLMLSLFDTDMGARTVRFQIGNIYKIDPARETNWMEVQIISARRRNPGATIWDIEGITEIQGEKKRVSIYYLSDTREGSMKFEDELRTQGVMETPSDARKVRALRIIIHRMIARYQNVHPGNLDEEIFRLFEKAKKIYYAEDHSSLAEAVKNI